jgi:hypothetical protein
MERKMEEKEAKNVEEETMKNEEKLKDQNRRNKLKKDGENYLHSVHPVACPKCI